LEGSVFDIAVFAFGISANVCQVTNNSTNFPNKDWAYGLTIALLWTLAFSKLYSSWKRYKKVAQIPLREDKIEGYLTN
jgi:hypothetical protein